MTTSSGYRTLATVLDLSGELGIDVRTVQTEADEEALVARVELVFPKESEGVDRSEALRRLAGVPPEDGARRAEAPAENATGEVDNDGTETAGSPTTATDAGPSHPESGAESGDRTVRRRPVLKGWDDDETTGTDDEAAETTETAEGTDVASSEGDTDENFHPCEVADCDRTFGTEHGMRIHVGRVHGSTTDADADTEGSTGEAEGDDEGEDASPPVSGGSEEVEVATKTDGGAPPDEGEALGADPFSAVGIDLPDDVDGEALVAALESSVSLREVAAELGLGRDETRELLSGLGLLDVVHGRVATAERRVRTKADIRDRLWARVTGT